MSIKKEAKTTNQYMITSGRQRDILNGWKVIDKEMSGLWSLVIYDKRDDFNLPIVNFPFTCSNIPVAPAMEYIPLSWSDIGVGQGMK
jgi:hypothetical protein